MQYLWSKISLWSTEKWNNFDFNQFKTSFLASWKINTQLSKSSLTLRRHCNSGPRSSYSGNSSPNPTMALFLNNIIWAATWDFQQCGMCDQQRLRPDCAYAQSDQSLCLSLEYYMNIKLLNEHNLEFLSLKEGYTGSSESIHFKMPHCWKSHVAAHLPFYKKQ